MKKRLLYFIRAILLLAFLVPTQVMMAQFTISMRNFSQTATNKLEFDVYLLDTDPTLPFELGTCQLGFLFDSDITNGGTISIAIDNTGSGLNASQVFTALPSTVIGPTGFPDQTLVRLAGRTPPGAGNGTIISSTAPGTKLTHFIITNTAIFTPGSTPDFIFCSSSVLNPLYPTRVSEYVGTTNTSLVVTPGTNAIVLNSPVLNTVPVSFSVTGTASYCQGTSGTPVGIDNSEPLVTYTLFKDAVAQVPALNGTGAAISFGNQTTGTYTVSGTNTYGTTAMSGSAVVTETPNPAAPIVSTTQPSCSVATGTITVSVIAGLNYSINGTDYSNTSGIFSLVNPGTYTVTARSAAGCTSSGTTAVINTQTVLPAHPELYQDQQRPAPV